jgi:hypothetical protein
MNKKRLLRKAHRYIGLLVSLQLLAWTIGGIWFAWNDIDNIHGDHLIKPNSNSEINQNLIAPLIVFENISEFKSLKSLTVIQILKDPVYQIEYITNNNLTLNVLADAKSGQIYPEINQQKAIDIAKYSTSFDAEIINIELVTETSKHHEYRGKPIPAWAITFDYPSSPTFYVSTDYGTITSIRHNSWRIFDFLWMLHTMDYEGRDNFGNWLIKIFSIIALITALSGIVLFFISRRKIKRP